MEHIEIRIHAYKPEIPINRFQNFIRCFPHTINICCQHTIRVMNKEGAYDEDDAETDDEGNNGRRIVRSPLAKVRKIVGVIRASGERKDTFRTQTINGNEIALWGKDDKGVPIKISPTELLHDVKTRWDSTYAMIDRFLEKKLVRVSLLRCICFSIIDTGYGTLHRQPILF